MENKNKNNEKEIKINFPEFLISQGYKPYNFIIKNNWNKDAKYQAQKILDSKIEGIVFKDGDFNSDESSFFVPCNFNTTYINANYNNTINGGIHTYFIKNNNFEKPIIFGLFERNSPPTLGYPRPTILYTYFDEKENRVCTINQQVDVAMNYCLKTESNIDILNSLFDDNIFVYNVV